MNSIFFSPPLHLPTHLHIKHTRPHLQSPPYNYRQESPLISLSLERCHARPIAATSPEGTVAVADFEDLMEKDWSFLDNLDSDDRKTDQVILSGAIGESSRVLISVGSERFVDRVIDSSPSIELLVVHESLFTLACIKEKHDKVDCWQGDLIFLPENWNDFEIVFLYFLPSLPFLLSQVLGTLAERCSPGARIVISHTQGREDLEEQRKKHPDVIISNLPDKDYIENAASDLSFELLHFVDEPGFYIAVLKYKA